RRLMLAITLLAAPAAALALVQDVTHATAIYWRFRISEPARSGPFVNHSHYAQFMNLSIGCALALLLMAADKRRWLTAMLLASFIVLGLATVSLSLSRGGMIAIVGAGFFTLLVLLSMRSVRWMGGIVAVPGLAALAAAFYLRLDRICAR